MEYLTEYNVLMYFYANILYSISISQHMQRLSYIKIHYTVYTIHTLYTIQYTIYTTL